MENKFKKIVSLVTVTCFIMGQMAYGSPPVGIEIAPSTEVPSFFQVDIPEDLATLDGVYEAPPSPDSRVILHIQNAHANYGAQQKIKKLLEYLNKTYSIKTVFVEGAAEDLNPDYLKYFPDKKRNMEMADLLAQQGELTGAELYLLETDDPKVQGRGIEDVELYRKNYEALKKVFGEEAVVDRYLNGFESRMERLSTKVFSNDLRKILADWQKFEKGYREFMPYVQRLAGDAKRVLDIDLESLFAQVEWPQITRLLALQAMEKEVNAAKAAQEKERLLVFLREKGVSPKVITNLENFKGQRVNIRQGQVDLMQPRQVLELLALEAGPKGFQFRDYPAFTVQAGYLILKNELDPKGLFEEIKTLFSRILDTLAETPRQKALLELYRDEELVRKLLNLELSRKELALLKSRQSRLGMEALIDRLKELNAAVTQELRLPPSDLETKTISLKFKNEILGLFDAASRFYDFAQQRESAFYKKIDSVMLNEDVNKAVLITGGFHTDGMTDLFREHGISYGVLTPRLMEKSNEKLYRRGMLQNEEQLFSLSYLEMVSRLTSYGAQIAQGRKPTESLGKILAAFRSKLPKEFATGQGVADAFNGALAAKAAKIRLEYLGRIDGKDSYKIVGLAGVGQDMAITPSRSELRMPGTQDRGYAALEDDGLLSKEEAVERLLRFLRSTSIEDLREYFRISGDFDLISKLNFALGGKDIIGTLRLQRTGGQIIDPKEAPFLEARRALTAIFKANGFVVYVGEGFDEFSLIPIDDAKPDINKLQEAVKKYTEFFMERYEILRFDKAISEEHAEFLKNSPYILRAGNSVTGGYLLISKRAFEGNDAKRAFFHTLIEKFGTSGKVVDLTPAAKKSGRGFFSVSVGAVSYGDVFDHLIEIIVKEKLAKENLEKDQEERLRQEVLNYWTEKKADGKRYLKYDMSTQTGKVTADRARELLTWADRLADDMVYQAKEGTESKIGRNQARVAQNKRELELLQRTEINLAGIEMEQRRSASPESMENNVDSLTGFYTKETGQKLVQRAFVLGKLNNVVRFGMAYQDWVRRRTFNALQGQADVGHHGGNLTITEVGNVIREIMRLDKQWSAEDLYNRGLIIYREAPDEIVIGIMNEGLHIRGPPELNSLNLDAAASRLGGFLKTNFKENVEKPFNPYFVVTNVDGVAAKTLRETLRDNQKSFEQHDLAIQELQNAITDVQQALTLEAWFVEAMKLIHAYKVKVGTNSQEIDVAAATVNELAALLETAADVKTQPGGHGVIVSLKPSAEAWKAFFRLYEEAAKDRAREALTDLGGLEVPIEDFVSDLEPEVGVQRGVTAPARSEGRTGAQSHEADGGMTLTPEQQELFRKQLGVLIQMSNRLNEYIERGRMNADHLTENYARMLDDIVKKAAEFSELPEGVALIAAGSYARKEQVYGTDFDLLMVVSDNTPVTPKLEKSLEKFRAFMTKIDYRLDEYVVPGGFWVTESKYIEFIQQNKLNPVQRNVLLDTRDVRRNGETELVLARLREAFQKNNLTPGSPGFLETIKTAIDNLKAISAERPQGILGQDDSFNVKSGPGALRNISYIIWAARIFLGIPGPENSIEELRKSKFFTDSEAFQLHASLNFFMRLRGEVNYLARDFQKDPNKFRDAYVVKESIPLSDRKPGKVYPPWDVSDLDPESRDWLPDFWCNELRFDKDSADKQWYPLIAFRMGLSALEFEQILSAHRSRVLALSRSVLSKLSVDSLSLVAAANQARRVGEFEKLTGGNHLGIAGNSERIFWVKQKISEIFELGDNTGNLGEAIQKMSTAVLLSEVQLSLGQEEEASPLDFLKDYAEFNSKLEVQGVKFEVAIILAASLLGVQGKSPLSSDQAQKFYELYLYTGGVFNPNIEIAPEIRPIVQFLNSTGLDSQVIANYLTTMHGYVQSAMGINRKESRTNASPTSQNQRDGRSFDQGDFDELWSKLFPSTPGRRSEVREDSESARSEVRKDLMPAEGQPRVLQDYAKAIEREISKQDPRVLRVLKNRTIREVSLDQADTIADVALKIAVIVRGNLDLHKSDPNRAADQMTALALAVGADITAAIKNALPEGHILPASDAIAREVRFVSQSSYEQYLEAVKVMLILNPSYECTFVMPNGTQQQVTANQKKLSKWINKEKLKDFAIKGRVRVMTESSYNAAVVKKGTKANTVFSVSRADQLSFMDIQGLRGNNLLVDLDIDQAQPGNVAAATAVQVKLAQKIAQKVGEAAEFSMDASTLPSLVGEIDGLDKNTLREGKVAITDLSLKDVITRIWQEFQAIAATQVAA